MEQENVETFADGQSNARSAGIAIGLASIVMIVFMAHHPLPASHDPQHLIEELVDHGFASAVVHGTLIGVIGVLFLGFTVLGDLLGPSKLSVRGGLIAYAIGSISMTAAALTDGFILPALAARYASEQSGALESFRESSFLLSLALAAAARLGVFSFSLAVTLWSLRLLRRNGITLVIGVLGLVVGAGPIVLLLLGHLRVNFHGMMAFIISQVIWYVAIAVQMIRGRI